MFLEWNHDLWMKTYIENINSLIDAESIGDIKYVSQNELHNYVTGSREVCQGWRETGGFSRSNNIYLIQFHITGSTQYQLSSLNNSE